MTGNEKPAWLRLVSLASALAVASCLALVYCGLRAVDFDLDAMGDAAGQLGRGPDAVRFGQLAMQFDLGFYFLQLPLLVALLRELRSSNGILVEVSTVAGAMYLMLGMLGAAILSVAWPFLANAYAGAPGEVEKGLIKDIYQLVTHSVEFGIWGRAEYILCATWVAGVGIAFVRAGRRLLGASSLLLAVAAFAAWIGCMLGDEALSAAAINLYILLSIIWLVFQSSWFGFRKLAPGG